MTITVEKEDMAKGTLSLSGSGSTTIPLGTGLTQFSWTVAGTPGTPNPASQTPITETINVDLTSKTTRTWYLGKKVTWTATVKWDVSIPILLTWNSK